MATLEKIRKRSVLLLIVIGVALLAFIIGDFFNSGRSLFGPDTNVANFGKEKIEAQEFQTRLNALNRNGGGEEASAMQSQNLLYSMILEKLTQEQYDKLGLVVTDKELSDAVNGNNPVAIQLAYQKAQQYLSELVQGPISPAQLYEITKNPSAYNLPEGAKAIWQEYEADLSKALLQQKFNNMIAGTMTVNKLEAQQLYNLTNTAYDLASVTKPFSALNAAQYTVTEQELNKAWEAEKNRFYVPEEMRLISYIKVDIVPSASDVVETEKMLGEVIEGLNTTPGLEALRGLKGFDPQESTMTLATIKSNMTNGANAAMKQFIDTAAVGQAALISQSNNNYQLMKLNGRGLEVDSITLSSVILDPQNTKLIDSISGLLAKGVPADTIAKTLAPQDGFVVGSVTTSLTTPGTELQAAAGQFFGYIANDLAAHKATFLTKTPGEVFSVDSLNAESPLKVLYVVNGRQAPEANVSFTLVNYQLNPSRETVKGLRSKLEAFVGENKSADKFVANALTEKYQYNPNNYTVSASAPVIVEQTGQFDQYGRRMEDYLPGSAEMVAWALEANKGDVSQVFGGEANGVFMVCAVNDVYGEYRTLSDPQVREMITEQVRQDKMATALINQYKGKANTIEGYATAMGSAVINAPVSMNDGGIYGPELLGKIFGSAAGKLYGPAQGQQGVMAYSVTKILAPTRPMTQQEMQPYQWGRQNMFTYGSPMFTYMLLGDRKIENRYNKVFHK